jgi:hypothetical protein
MLLETGDASWDIVLGFAYVSSISALFCGALVLK